MILDFILNWIYLEFSKNTRNQNFENIQKWTMIQNSQKKINEMMIQNFRGKR